MEDILIKFTTDLIGPLDGFLHFRFFAHVSMAAFMPDFIGRLDGPLHLRFIVQPLMAAVFAFRDGRRDAQEGQTPYGWAVLTAPEHRRFLIKDGWKGISKVFILAFVLDLVYQFIALRAFHPKDALIIASLLALIPYVLLRGPANRLMSLQKQ